MTSKGSIQIESIVPSINLPGGILTSSPLGLILSISGHNETTVLTRYLAGEELSENDAVFINASGFIQRALASTSSTMPCIGLASVIPVSIALSGGVNVSGKTGIGISVSAASGSPIVVVTRGIKDSIFTSLSGDQGINTSSLIVVSGGTPNVPVYVSNLSAGLITVEKPSVDSSGLIQRVGFAVFNSGGLMVNPDPFYYYPTSNFGVAF